MLIEAAVDELPEAIGITKRAMARASRQVLDGFELRTSPTVTRKMVLAGDEGEQNVWVYPERYMDVDRGERMWNLITGYLDEVELKYGTAS
jgi:hypothetical protein